MTPPRPTSPREERGERLLFVLGVIVCSIALAGLILGPNIGFDQPWRGLMTALWGVLWGVCLTLAVQGVRRA